MTLEIRCFSGDPWSPSGMSDGDTATLYSVATETFTITEDTDTVKLWFSGKGEGCSGPRTTLIASAYITQGGKSTPVSVRGVFSNVVIPSSGCWSDTVSVADFTLPGDVSFIVNYVEATNLPTYSDNTVPTDPVPVSAVHLSPEAEIDYNTANSDIVLDDDCTSLVGWTTWTGGNGTATLSGGGILLDSGTGIKAVTITKTLNWCPDIGILQATISIPTLNTFASNNNLVMAIGNKLADISEISCPIYAKWCSDGLYVFNGATYDNMSDVVTGGEQTWKFVFDTRNGSDHSINVYEVVGGEDVFINSTVVPVDGISGSPLTIMFGQAGHTDHPNQQAIIQDIYYTGTPGYNRLPFRDDFNYTYSGWEYSGTYSYTLLSGKLNMAGTGGGEVLASREIVVPSPVSTCTVELKIKCNELPATFVNNGVGNNCFGLYAATGEDICAMIFIATSGLYYGTEKISDITIDEDYVIRIEINSTTSTQKIYVNNVLCDERIIELNAITDSMLVMMWAGVDESTPTEGIDVDLDYLLIREGFGVPSDALTETPKSGDITINANPSPGETFTVSNSATTVFTFVDHYPNNATEIQIGATTALTAQALATAINNISGAEFVATVDGSVISVDAYCESAFAMTTTSTGIEISSITEIVPGLTTETVTAADSFTATEGGKSVQENATAADSTDGLIDGSAESASVSTVFDTLNVEMDETIEATVTTDFDGLIEYMGEEIT